MQCPATVSLGLFLQSIASRQLPLSTYVHKSIYKVMILGDKAVRQRDDMAKEELSVICYDRALIETPDDVPQTLR